MNRIQISCADFVVSAVNSKNYPAEKLPEIAFIGRSNVGKSSLINSLTNRKNLAHTSQNPGKTQTINFFKIEIKNSENDDRQNFYLVDLPGYGYAKTSKVNRAEWAKFIAEYLTKSLKIKFVCQLIDIRHPPTKDDITKFKWLVEHEIPVLIIATKSDKIPRSQIQKSISQIKNDLGIQELSVIPYSSITSAEKNESRSDLLDVIYNSLLESD